MAEDVLKDLEDGLIFEGEVDMDFEDPPIFKKLDNQVGKNPKDKLVSNFLGVGVVSAVILPLPKKVKKINLGQKEIDDKNPLLTK